MEATGVTCSKDLLTWKINTKKICTVEEQNDFYLRQHIQVLSISKNTKKLRLIIKKFKNIFVILIEFDAKIDEILKLIAVKFTNRPLLVQVKSENSLNFYIKRENEFKRVESASNYENVKITAEILLGNLKTSIIEANFSHLTAHDGGFIKHCDVVDSGDDFCFRLLNLYEDNFNMEMQCEILLSVIKCDNFKFFLAFSNVFELPQIFKPNSEELTSDLREKFEEILKHLIKIGDVENCKIILKFLSHNQLLEVNFDSLFIRVVEFVVENNFYEFHEVLRNVKIWYTERQMLHYATRLGLSDLFINALKSQILKFYLIDFSSLNNFFSFFGDLENFNLYKNVNVELMVQDVLIELLSDEWLAKDLIENKSLFNEVISYGFESNLRFLYAKMIEIFTQNEIRNILRKENVLIVSAQFSSKIDSVRFVWKMIEKNFKEYKMCEYDIKNIWVHKLLHIVAEYAKSEEICEFIWLKINSLIKNDKKLRHLLLSKEIDDSNALIKSVDSNNEISFKFLLEKVSFKLLGPKSFIYNTKSRNKNVIQCLAQNSSTSMLEFSLNLFKERLTSKQLRDCVILKDHQNKNILNFAILNRKDEHLVKFLANFIENEFGIEYLRKMLSEDDDEGFILFHNTIKNNKNTQIFEHIISIYEEKFSFHELQKILSIEKLIHIHISLKIHENPILNDVEKFLRKYFDPMVSYYLELTELMIKDESCDDLMNFFVKIEKLKKKNEVIKFLLFEIKILNIFVEFAQSKLKFKFLCHKIVDFIQDREDLKDILLARDSNGLIALNLLIHGNYNQFFLFLFDEIYCVHLNFEDFIYEKDSEGNNFFHKFMHSGSKTLIEFVVNQFNVKLSKEKFKEFLRLKNNRQQNLLHVMANSFNLSKEKWIFMKKIFDSELSLHEIKEMMMEIDENGQFPLHLALQREQYFILPFFVENFTVDEVEAMIKKEMIFDVQTNNHFCKIAERFRYQNDESDEDEKFDIFSLFKEL